MKLIVANFTYKIPDEATVINTTSRASGWSRGLSPFFLGPVKLYGDYVSQNVENAWQYCKCFVEHLDEHNEPGPAYFYWAQRGWNRKVADRYPMGRGSKPLYSLWDGQKLGYVDARKQIYIPLYSNAVKDTPAFAKLKEIYKSTEFLVLQDFDAHNLNVIGYDINKLIDNDKIKVGHGYVLAMMLLGLI
jgi:hypothetical protein